MLGDSLYAQQAEDGTPEEQSLRVIGCYRNLPSTWVTLKHELRSSGSDPSPAVLAHHEEFRHGPIKGAVQSRPSAQQNEARDMAVGANQEWQSSRFLPVIPQPRVRGESAGFVYVPIRAASRCPFGDVVDIELKELLQRCSLPDGSTNHGHLFRRATTHESHPCSEKDAALSSETPGLRKRMIAADTPCKGPLLHSRTAALDQLNPRSALRRSRAFAAPPRGDHGDRPEFRRHPPSRHRQPRRPSSVAWRVPRALLRREAGRG